MSKQSNFERTIVVAGGRPSRSSIYQRLDEAITDLNDRLGGLPSPAEADGIWADLWHQEAHHSTALEGNTLILSEVQKLLDEGRAVGDKELREYLEVLGYGAAAKWVYGQALEPGGWSADGLLTLQEVRSVHFQAMTRCGTSHRTRTRPLKSLPATGAATRSRSSPTG
ncbi:Fic family protein [Jatrophihabitans lederbergiae]|uniref:Uncharacterized protein n=1 Tax=Jatrophihabitans lederbergiae TaxID=3075547 RepID=A0ABU2JIK7_9ACTN|nr:hypothetical protein [Jatrophihabitans sp. DSM 44399]MDT0264083.1 hypothetical protein [Jatrophihabitans sp. DSM 44399]